jgi:hypothetical protein
VVQGDRDGASHVTVLNGYHGAQHPQKGGGVRGGPCGEVIDELGRWWKALLHR